MLRAQIIEEKRRKQRSNFSASLSEEDRRKERTSSHERLERDAGEVGDIGEVFESIKDELRNLPVLMPYSSQVSLGGRSGETILIQLTKPSSAVFFAITIVKAGRTFRVSHTGVGAPTRTTNNTSELPELVENIFNLERRSNSDSWKEPKPVPGPRDSSKIRDRR